MQGPCQRGWCYSLLVSASGPSIRRLQPCLCPRARSPQAREIRSPESTRKRDVITCTVTLVFHENTLREKRETFVVPLRKIGDLNLVKSFVFQGTHPRWLAAADIARPAPGTGVD
jgi:hypothetical protein